MIARKYFKKEEKSGIGLIKFEREKSEQKTLEWAWKFERIGTKEKWKES